MDLLRDMAVFVAVAKARNFSRAAESLGMPVSSVSRRVSEMEAQLGIPLFTRSTRKVELTDAGSVYYERCRSIIEAAESAQDDLRGHADKPRGRLRVSATPDFALVFLTSIFADFARKYPEISFEFDLSPRWVDLVAEGFDVAIRVGALPEASSLTVRRLVNASTGIYASSEYLARHGEPREAADLERHECIRILRPHATQAVWTLLKGETEVDVTVSGRFAVNNPRMILGLAVLGLGVAAIDETIARPDVEAGRLRRLLPGYSLAPVPIYAVTPSRLMPAKTRLFIECLAQNIQIARRAP